MLEVYGVKLVEMEMCVDIIVKILWFGDVGALKYCD